MLHAFFAARKARKEEAKAIAQHNANLDKWMKKKLADEAVQHDRINHIIAVHNQRILVDERYARDFPNGPFDTSFVRGLRYMPGDERYFAGYRIHY